MAGAISRPTCVRWEPSPSARCSNTIYHMAGNGRHIARNRQPQTPVIFCRAHVGELSPAGWHIQHDGEHAALPRHGAASLSGGCWDGEGPNGQISGPFVSDGGRHRRQPPMERGRSYRANGPATTAHRDNDPTVTAAVVVIAAAVISSGSSQGSGGRIRARGTKLGGFLDAGCIQTRLYA